MFRHVVCFRFREDKKDMINEAKEMILKLSKISEVKSIEAGTDEVKSERSFDLVVIADFESRKDYEIYDKHELHKSVKDYVLGLISDAAAVDYSFEL